MNRQLLLLATLAAAWSLAAGYPLGAAPAQRQTTAPRPNIVIIMADDK